MTTSAVTVGGSSALVIASRDVASWGIRVVLSGGAGTSARAGVVAGDDTSDGACVDFGAMTVVSRWEMIGVSEPVVAGPTVVLGTTNKCVCYNCI